MYSVFIIYEATYFVKITLFKFSTLLRHEMPYISRDFMKLHLPEISI